MELSCGPAGSGSSVVTAAAWVAAVVWVQSLAQELPPVGVAKNIYFLKIKLGSSRRGAVVNESD